MKNTLLMTFAAALMSACAVGPDYEATPNDIELTWTVPAGNDQPDSLQ